MTTLSEARLPSLRDKIESQKVEVKKVEVKDEKKNKRSKKVEKDKK